MSEERRQSDWHLAAELEREAMEAIEREVLPRIHSAMALYAIDTERGTSFDDRNFCNRNYQALTAVSGDIVQRYSEKFSFGGGGRGRGT